VKRVLLRPDLTQIIGNSRASEFVLSEVDTLCLIVDVKMPGISGSELQSHLAAKCCSIRYSASFADRGLAAFAPWANWGCTSCRPRGWFFPRVWYLVFRESVRLMMQFLRAGTTLMLAVDRPPKNSKRLRDVLL
jgi:hypothetical protein